jgi:hypothetical protein
MLPSSRQENSLEPDVLDTYRIQGNVFLVGALEKSLTVYSQQVRAHNLVWALASHPAFRPDDRERRIAVIGSGIAGLTATAALLLTYPKISVVLLEKRSALCPLLQGSDTRWIHPRIYMWPQAGSRAPSASLPLLDWREGRASDVVDRVLRQFTIIREYAASQGRHCRAYVDARSVQVDPSKTSVSWSGIELSESPNSRGLAKEPFDAIVVATGFGLEAAPKGFSNQSYWRNESLAQPTLTQKVSKFIVSGYGDGALVDLCRLTIQRFRQDRIIEDLFGENPENTEEMLRSTFASNAGRTFATSLKSLPVSWSSIAVRKLHGRLRRDTNVVLHLGGRSSQTKSLESVLEYKASFLNKLLLHLLLEAKGCRLSFESLRSLVRRYPAGGVNVLCRHGSNPFKDVVGLFKNGTRTHKRLEQMQAAQAQVPTLLSPAGFYPFIRE